jgi:hypothetical protein
MPMQTTLLALAFSNKKSRASRVSSLNPLVLKQTPVLLGVTDRAELGTEEVNCVCKILEGVVIVKDNPDYQSEEKK